MKKLLEQIKNDIKKWYPCALAVAAYCMLVEALLGRLCPMAAFTGYPCPGCGLTRAGLAVFHFRWSEAFRINFCIYLIIPYVFYCLFCRYFRGGACRGGKFFFCIILVCLVGLYTYRMVFEFPGTPPMEYYEPNLLRKFIAWYTEWQR